MGCAFLRQVSTHVTLYTVLTIDILSEDYHQPAQLDNWVSLNLSPGHSVSLHCLNCRILSTCEASSLIFFVLRILLPCSCGLHSWLREGACGTADICCSQCMPVDAWVDNCLPLSSYCKQNPFISCFLQSAEIKVREALSEEFFHGSASCLHG